MHFFYIKGIHQPPARLPLDTKQPCRWWPPSTPPCSGAGSLRSSRRPPSTATPLRSWQSRSPLHARRLRPWSSPMALHRASCRHRRGSLQAALPLAAASPWSSTVLTSARVWPSSLISGMLLAFRFLVLPRPVLFFSGGVFRSLQVPSLLFLCEFASSDHHWWLGF